MIDWAELMTVCGNWPAIPVPEHRAEDPLLERVRQVLMGLHRGVGTTSSADLVPLIRHVMLRAVGDGQPLSWLRVPLAKGWPTADEWAEAQFEVANGQTHVTVRPRWPRLSFLPGQEDLFDDAFKGVVSRPNSWISADPFFQRAMGLDQYTCDGQREAVRALLHLPPGDTLIANLPTGSGKSVLAQLPPLVTPAGMLTLVIVPTVALALDQATRASELLSRLDPHRALPPLAFHGGLSEEECSAVFRAISSGAQPVLFTSPENAVGRLRTLLEAAADGGRVSGVVIDEAHLVIGWGTGFRPAFQLLPALVQSLRRRLRQGDLRVVLASATLTGSTLRQLRRLFGPDERTHVVSAVNLRPELRYAFSHVGQNERHERVLEALRLAPRPFILYVTRPDETTDWLRTLREAGFSRVEKFSGDTSAPERERLLEAWKQNTLDGMVATSAFGLGVDKNDVRTIIHATLPESLDRFYQEVGRAGRDGKAGAALLLYTDDDGAQAERLATPTLIGDDLGFDRWTLLIDKAARVGDWYWLNLELLTARLPMPSKANCEWNIRTLTLMARAELIELVSLRTDAGDSVDVVPIEIGLATQAAVRLLDDGHRNKDVFSARLAQARQDSHEAARRGFKSMLAVARRDVEISRALQDMYSVAQGDFTPVTASCGGCPEHWTVRTESVRYRPPRAARLPRFSNRVPDRFAERLRLGRTSNLSVIAVANEQPYAQTCAALVGLLAPALECHTVVLETSFAKRHRDLVATALNESHAPGVFIDTLEERDRESWPAGENEVRIVLWGDQDARPLPDAMFLSPAQMDLVIIPSELPHAHHPLRRFIDTTPHIQAADVFRWIAQ